MNILTLSISINQQERTIMANQLTSKTLSAAFINTFIKSKFFDTLDRITDWVSYWNSLKTDNNCNYMSINLPVKKIDGIDVVVNLELYDDGSLWIDIIKNNIWIINTLGKISDNFKGIDIGKYSINILNENCNPQRLTYLEENDGDDDEYCLDLNDDYFVENPYFKNVDFVKEINKIINLKWNSILGFIDYEISLEDIELLGYDLGECAVCYEKTNNKCKNNHYTCVDCVSNIYKQNTRVKVKCPLCRENM